MINAKMKPESIEMKRANVLVSAVDAITAQIDIEPEGDLSNVSPHEQAAMIARRIVAAIRAGMVPAVSINFLEGK